MAQYEDSIVLPVSRDVLFDFLSKPLNIAKISDPNLGLKFAEAPDIVSQGSRVVIHMMTMGQLQKATHEIATFDRPSLIVEVQVEGPMKAWRHEHIFEEADGQTRMIDRIEYTRPGGIIGLLLTDARVTDMLEENFFQREQNLRRLISQGHFG